MEHCSNGRRRWPTVYYAIARVGMAEASRRWSNGTPASKHELFAAIEWALCDVDVAQLEDMVRTLAGPKAYLESDPWHGPITASAHVLWGLLDPDLLPSAETAMFYLLAERCHDAAYSAGMSLDPRFDGCPRCLTPAGAHDPSCSVCRRTNKITWEWEGEDEGESGMQMTV